MNKGDRFYLDTEEGSIECQIITNIYSEERKKHYLIYEYVENESQYIYISSYNPEDKEGNLNDVTNEQELEEITKFLEEFEEYE